MSIVRLSSSFFILRDNEPPTEVSWTVLATGGLLSWRVDLLVMGVSRAQRNVFAAGYYGCSLWCFRAAGSTGFKHPGASVKYETAKRSVTLDSSACGQASICLGGLGAGWICW